MQMWILNGFWEYEKSNGIMVKEKLKQVRQIYMQMMNAYDEEGSEF